MTTSLLLLLATATATAARESSSVSMIQPSAGLGLGTALHYQFGVFVTMPINTSDAVKEGWSPDDGGACQEGLGIRYSQNGTGPTKDTPISLYFTPFGQVSGVGTLGLGAFEGLAVEHGYWKRVLPPSLPKLSPSPDPPNPVPPPPGQCVADEVCLPLNGHRRDCCSGKEPAKKDKKCDGLWKCGKHETWRIDVGFRSLPDSCSHDRSPFLLGDRAVINPEAGGVGRTLPTRLAAATAEGYSEGACMGSMGTHAFFDLAGKNGSMTWQMNNLMPVVPMYDRNNDWNLNAVFFTTPWIQQGLGPNGYMPRQWEPSPLPNPLMCRNFCDEKCGWKDTYAWSTMHVYFTPDPAANIVCQKSSPVNCFFGCCENHTGTEF